MAQGASITISAEDKTDRAFRAIQNNLNSLDTNVKNVTGSFSNLGGVVAGIVSAGSVATLVGQYREFASELIKSSSQLGISTERLQIMQGAAVAAGGAATDLTDAMLTLDESIAEARVEGGEKAAIFEALGISLKNAKGEALSTDEIFSSLTGAIGNLKDQALQTKIANDLMGGSVNEIISVIRDGDTAFSAYEQKLRNIGGITSDVALQDVSKLNDNLQLLEARLNTIGAEVISKVVGPALDALVTNFEDFEKVIIIVASALTTAAIPSLLTAITTALGALKIAIATNPIGAIAVGVTTAGVAAYQYKDDIADFFGLVDKDAASETEQTSKAIKKVGEESQGAAKTTKEYADAFKEAEERQQDVKKTEEERSKSAKEFGRIINVIKPDIGEVNQAVKNLMGIEGFGGLQKALIEFLGGAHENFLFYLGLTQGVVVEKLADIEDEFTSVLSTIENIVVYRRDQVSSAFSTLMDSIQTEVESLEVQVKDLTIDVPASAFSFTKTIIPVDDEAFAFEDGSIKVPATVFNTTDIAAYNTAMDKNLNSLVSKVNNVDVTSRSSSRSATAYGSSGVLSGYGQPVPYWTGEGPSGTVSYGSKNLSYDVPSLSYSSTARSLSRSSMASRSSSAGSGASMSSSQSPTIEVNIFDGTGQKISEYDSALRVEITERAARNNQFAAVAA